MFFRYSSSIASGIGISPNFGKIKLSPNEFTTILFCGSNDGRVKIEHCKHHCYCEAVYKLDAGEENESIFELLDMCSTSKYQTDNEVVAPYPGEWVKIIVVDPRDFPPAFDNLVTSTTSFFNKLVKDFIKTFRWRMNFSEFQSKTSFSCFEWSKDKVYWNRFNYIFPQPAVHIYELLDASGVPQEELNSLVKELNSLVTTSSTEPIYHELFREAWGLRHGNPRSSIVIGISAAEVAMKECVGELIPDARWLVEESPSPPLMAMIKNYLPLLPFKNRFNGKVLSPPKSVRRDIEEGVKLRNKVVHVGHQVPNNQWLEKILLSVKDFLWLVDYYRGYDWSLTYIRDETLKDMGVSKADIQNQ
jgi:hypothetical protein